jgi:alpha-tubulin suppressor-like RCC1 family protein
MVDLLGRAWAFGINIFGQLGLEHNDQDTDTS